MYPIIDCHCHIYPDKIAEKAVKSIGEFYGLKMRNSGTLEEMKESSKEAGIIHSVVFSVATKPSQVKPINEFIFEQVNKSNGTMTGLGTLHPDSKDIEGDINYLLKLGLKGVKLHPDIQGFKTDDYRCLKIYELCEEKRLPVLIHAGDNRYDLSNPNRLKPVLDIYSNLTVIAAHLGGWSIWETASDELSGYKNLYVDCSSSFYSLTPDKAVNIIRKYGADRVLFGTDYPMWTMKEEVEKFMALDLTETEREKILYKNALSLFNIAI